MQSYSGFFKSSSFNSTSLAGGGLEAGIPDFPGAAEFTRAVGAIRGSIEEASRTVERLAATHENRKGATSSAKSKKIDEEMQEIMADVSRRAKSIKDAIHDLRKSNARAQRKEGCEAGSQSDEFRKNVTQSLAEGMGRVITKFFELRQQIDLDQRNAIARKVQVVTGQAPTEEQLSALVQGGGSDEFLAVAVRAQGEQGARNAVTTAIDEINERRGAVEELTSKMQVVAELFQDMAVLLDSHTEILDEIEEEVEGGRRDVETGRVKLQDARKRQLSTRQWTMIGVAVLILVLLIVGIPVGIAIRNAILNAQALTAP